MILIIDNYDSFVHNLARYLREAGSPVRVVRNDQVTAAECVSMAPSGVVLSPGPKTPADAGCSLDLIATLPARTPLFGVCLGHQCLVEAFGGETVRADDPLHGEASLIRHTGAGIFEGVPSPTPAGRYHSLIARPRKGSPIVETAWTENGALMGAAHRINPWFGVQFHPESLLTPHGRRMVENFLRICMSGEAA